MVKISSKNKQGILLMLISSLFVCIGQLFWKLASMHGYIHLLLGFFFYIVGSFVMIKAYHYGDLHVLQPILSVGYVLSLFFGIIILNEEVKALNFIGVALIILGVFFIITGEKQ